MPSTIVHAGFALLLAAGLLGNHYDRRALAAVLLIIIIPEIDSVLGPVMPGAHRTVGHNVVIPIALGALVFYDTQIRTRSALRERITNRWDAATADRWIAIAWVGLFAHLFAHIALDWAHLDGVNALWPLHDRFYRLEGELFLSTADGLVQTFIDIQIDPETGERQVDSGGGGTTETVHVNNPVEPSDPADATDGPIDRRFPIANAGWRLYLIGIGLFTIAARRLQRTESSDTSA